MRKNEAVLPSYADADGSTSPRPRASPRGLVLFLITAVLASLRLGAEDGYRLWLRYDPLPAASPRGPYTRALGRITFVTRRGEESPTLAAARDEISRGLEGLLGVRPVFALQSAPPAAALGEEGYALRRNATGLELHAAADVGVLYGAFALLRAVQTLTPVARLADLTSVPRIQHRMLNHWDNLNGTIERGYAGGSLWEWEKLPQELSPRYRDYARACASLGLNGTVLTNVNANAKTLTAEYLRKVAALAEVFRPYGIKVYLTARFSAPIELGKLRTADPLDPEVIAWWRAKVDEIYAQIPDFGGFLVKANSEGQPGPQAYQRNHADGANLLAAAVAPHGGIVIWRAFVYDNNVADDRAKQAYTEFVPLDGAFRDNVLVQVKNGPIDFMPREPFHPLFGAMPRTPLALEVQITQEYLGGSTQLAFLAPMWREVLDATTGRPQRTTTVAQIVDGSAERHRLTAIAGVANTGNQRTWSGNVLAPANWYAFGRLAWDPSLSAESVAEEWARQTFSNDPATLAVVKELLFASREAVVDYSMPLGLHHLMARGHHQGPGPWVATGRADQTATYYHRADEHGIGFDRTATGSNALAQYAPEVAATWSDPKTCPENLLLWFHHLPWDFRLRSGRILWDELALHYQRGVDKVRGWQKRWSTLATGGTIDPERFAAVSALLARQEREARVWRDASLLYFGTFSKRPLPSGVEAPAHPLDVYRRAPAPFSLATDSK